MTNRLRPMILGANALFLLLACASPGATTPPSARPSPVPTPSVTPTPAPTGQHLTVSSAAHAAAIVFASDERWARMIPLRPDLIGQSTWYEAFDDGSGFTVRITAGQGDCMAGCIEKRTWTYSVDGAGSVELVGEEGDGVAIEPPSGGDGPARITVEMTSGPVCPVERIPPDPNCAARPVAGAEVVVYDASGHEVARETSDADGRVALDVPAGAYYAVPAQLPGLMGTPEAQAFAVVGGDEIGLAFGYDTGIR